MASVTFRLLANSVARKAAIRRSTRRVVKLKRAVGFNPLDTQMLIVLKFHSALSTRVHSETSIPRPFV